MKKYLVIFALICSLACILVSPFDTRDFKQKWPDIDIHKNNPTVLYYGG